MSPTTTNGLKRKSWSRIRWGAVLLNRWNWSCRWTRISLPSVTAKSSLVDPYEEVSKPSCACQFASWSKRCIRKRFPCQFRDSGKLNCPRIAKRGYTVSKKALGDRKMELVEEVKALFIETTKDLKGSARRLFMARTVRALGEGGQRRAERELGWNRGTIRKGQQELEHGIVCIDAYSSRGRKRSEEHLPNLLRDITAIVDGQSQADPQFRSNRLYTRLTATEVRRQLIAQKGYSDKELPTAETIGTKLNELGYYLNKVAKTQPQKNCPKPMPSLPN